MMNTHEQKAEKASEMLIKHSLFVGNMHIGYWVPPAGSLV